MPDNHKGESKSERVFALQKTKIRLIAVFLAVIMAFGLLPVTVTASADVTVAVSFEGYNLGYGFYIEPAEVTLPAGSSAMDATLALLSQRGHVYELNAWGGLDRVHGFHSGGTANPPAYITLDLALGSNDGSLGSFDYSTYSGWIVTVDHFMLPVGADEHFISDGEVIRWQFSVEGWGADLGLGTDRGFWSDPPYVHADKTNLIRGLFEQGITSAAKQTALSVIIDPLATAAEVSAALTDILAGQAPQAADKSELTSAVSEANSLQQQAYTPASWAVLQSALNSAQSVSSNIFATQEAVNRAALRLKTAVASLEAITQPAPTWQEALEGVLGWLLTNIPNPSIGNEWAVIALARANIAADTWFDSYLSALKIDGLTSWTDFQRVTLALTALETDAGSFNGNDLLADFRNFTSDANRPLHSQGVNADIFALIALNSRPYTGAQQQYTESILAAQTPSGAWAWGDWASADITAMAIQALAPYYGSNTAVTAAINKGFGWIETETLDSAEDYAQVIIALTAIGRSAEKYVAELLNFYDEATGGFISPWTGLVNAMSSEQAAYALAAHYRHENGMNTLFDMRDAGRGTITLPGTGTGTGTGTPTHGRAFISVRNDNPSSGGKKIFFEGNFDLNPNETAYTLLQRTGLTIGTRGMYVYSIEGLAEFDYGAGSGWMYSVNGVFPVTAASDYIVRNNNRVEWLYTSSLGQDIGGSGETPLPSPANADKKDDDDEETETQEETAARNETETPFEIPEAYEVWINPYSDISEADWFYPYAKFMYENGLMTGVAQGVFAPDINFSRSMAVHVLWRLEARPHIQSMDFDDVEQGKWYSDAVAWARADGIVQGFTDGTFRPSAHITREHFAVMLRNYGESRGIVIDSEILSLVGSDTLTRAEAAVIFRMFIES
jgi:hypothetical protein